MDMKKVEFIGNVLKVVIGAVGAILCLMIISADKCPDSPNELCDGTIPIIGYAINLSLGALLLCGVVALLFGLIYFAGHIKQSKGTLFGLVGLGVIAGISYAMAADEVYPEWEKVDVTAQVSKLSGMGINFVLILLALAVLTALFSEVTKLVK
jgi:hypothetical protein